MPVLNLTWYQLACLGIGQCECGHPFNNHFDHGKKACAHCECKQLKRCLVLPPRSRAGRSGGVDR